MLAAADYAEGKSTVPPPELSLWWDMRDFGALPAAGGLLDQPAGLLKRIRIAASTFEAVQEFKTNGMKPGQGASWRAAHPETLAIVKRVDKLREE